MPKLAKLKSKKFILVTFAVLIIVSGAGTLAYLQFNTEHPPLPDNIKQKLSFTPYSNGQKGVAAAPTKLRYDSEVKNLNYQSAIKGVRVEVSQQATPVSFKSSPVAYDKFISGFGSTDSFDSPAGKVYVTRPKNAATTQVAVLNTGSVLLFVRPVSTIGIDDWKQFFVTLNTAR